MFFLCFTLYSIKISGEIKSFKVIAFENYKSAIKITHWLKCLE